MPSTRPVLERVHVRTRCRTPHIGSGRSERRLALTSAPTSSSGQRVRSDPTGPPPSPRLRQPGTSVEAPTQNANPQPTPPALHPRSNAKHHITTAPSGQPSRRSRADTDTPAAVGRSAESVLSVARHRTAVTATSTRSVLAASGTHCPPLGRSCCLPTMAAALERSSPVLTHPSAVAQTVSIPPTRPPSRSGRCRPAPLHRLGPRPRRTAPGRPASLRACCPPPSRCA